MQNHKLYEKIVSTFTLIL